MEYLKLILVDDEPIILEGFTTTYPWKEMGFEVVGTYLSGELVLQNLEQTKPDVIMTDVRMKNMSGIDLMEKVNAIFPEILFVVVSAYRDFEYAQSACDLGAFSYLLKPVDQSKLLDTMSSVYQTCIEKRKSYQEKQQLVDLLRDNKNSYLAVIAERYVTGSVNETEFLHVFELLQDSIVSQNSYATLIVNLDISYRLKNEVEYETKRFTLYEYLIREVSKQANLWYFRGREGQLICLLSSELGGDLQDSMKRILKQARDLYQVEIISAISNTLQGISQLKRTYEEAVSMFEMACESGAEILIAQKDYKGLSDSNEFCKDAEIYIINAIRKNDLLQFKDAYIKYIFSLPKDNVDYIYTCIHSLALNIEILLHNTYGYTDEIKKKFQLFYQNYHEVHETKAIDLLYRIIQLIIEERVKHPQKNVKQVFADYIHQALLYIEEHISEETLSINDVANAIYLNPVYFGRVFKSSQGISFKQYVQNRRMELAKQLITERRYNLTIIGQKVGITNSSYFSQLFKQYTGVLPSEYREILS